MKYERLTERRESPLTMSMWGGSIKDLRVYNRLIEYENDEESGRIVRLPCNVGDIVYQFDNGGEIYELMIIHINIYNRKPYYETDTIDFDNTAIGNSIFLTREEAEKRLKELRE